MPLVLVLGFKPPSPSLIVAAVMLLLLAVAAARADLQRLAEWMVVGGWFVYALTSPSAEFPHVLRPLGPLAAAGGAVLYRMGRPKIDEFKHRFIPFPTRLLLIYVAFVFVGCLASPLGPKNMFRWIQGVLIIGAAFYGVSLGLGRKMLASTWFASIGNVVLTVISGAHEVLPDGTHSERLAGYMQPNHLAFTCAVVIIGVVWLWRQLPQWRLPLAGIGLISTYTLLASHSRTALLALMAAMIAGTIASFIGPTRRGRAAAWALVGTLLLAPVVVPVFGTWFNRDDSTQSITSLTGRTDFWPLAVDLIEQRPVVGWGVNVILSPVGYKFQEVLPGVGQAHNAYLEAALQGGIPGVLAWGAALLGVVFGAFRLPRSDPYRFLLISCGILVEFFALTESSPAWFGDMFIIYVLALAVYGERYTRARAATRSSRPDEDSVASASFDLDPAIADPS